MRYVAAATILVLGWAAAEDALVLRFADGRSETVTVSSWDEEGVLAGPAEAPRKILWTDLTPDSAFRAREALTPMTDAGARRELAEFARGLKLFPEAMEELATALALGGVDEAAFEKLEKEIATEEQEYLCARIDALLASGDDPAACLTAIRALKARYPDHPGNAKYEPRIGKLAEVVAQARDGKPKGQADDKELLRLTKAVADLQAKKDKALQRAEALRKEAEPAIAKGQLSSIKRALLKPTGAEQHYREARKYLRMIARTDPSFLVTSREDLQKEYERIGANLVDSYLAVARALMRERNYKGTVEYVRRILLFDPIHEEALKMVEEIERNRIGFKASATGGAVPEPRRVDG